MSLLVALGITIGVLAGLLCVICNLLAMTGVTAIMLLAWPGFVAWACYFAVGGKPEGLGKTMICNGWGAVMGFLMVLLGGALSFIDAGIGLGVAIAVVIGAFILCVEARWKWLSFIPGAFCGCAVSFGTGGCANIELLIMAILSMWVGALLAYVSDIWAQKMVKKP